MRSTVFAAITATACALAACGGEQPAPQPPPPPPPAPTASVSAEPVATAPPPAPKPSLDELIPQTLKGIGAAFNAHDAKKVASYYTEDAVVSAYGAPDSHGRDALAAAMEGLFGSFSDVKSAPLRAWAKGNVVIAETAWTGTMTSDFMGHKATQKPVGQLRANVIWFNDDGLVKEMHEYGDSAGLMAQVEGKKNAPPVPVLPANLPEVHLSIGSPDEDKVAAWGKSLDETFSKDDVKAVVASLADDADYWVNISDKPVTKGKKDLTRELEGWFKAFPDQKWTTTNVWGIDGFAIVEHTMTGTQKGRLGPIPASNKEVTSWHWLDILQPSKDGKLQHGWAYANLLEALRQTGALEKPVHKVAAEIKTVAKPAAKPAKPAPAAK